MYKYNSAYHHEMLALYDKMLKISDAFDTTPEYVLNDMSNYHLNNYE